MYFLEFLDKKVKKMNQKEFYRLLKTHNVSNPQKVWKIHKSRQLNKKQVPLNTRWIMKLVPFTSEEIKNEQLFINSRFSSWANPYYKLPKDPLYKSNKTYVDTGSRGYIHKRSTLRHHLILYSYSVIIGNTIVLFYNGKKKKTIKLPINWKIDFNEEFLCIINEQNNEIEFHPTSNDIMLGTYHLVREAKKNYIKRKRVERANIVEKLSLLTTWITRNDSISAGNCASETDKFIDKLKEKLNADGEIGAVRASFLLNIRKDIFTERAVKYAMMHKIK